MIDYMNQINLIEMLKYIIIGVVQGVAEVMPISSSGHMLLFSKLFNININLATEVFLHLGSLIAVIIFLRKELSYMIINFLKFIFKIFNNIINKNNNHKTKIEKHETDNFKMVIYLILSTIPLVIMTLLLNNYIDKINTNIMCVSFLLMVNGLMVYITGKRLYINKNLLKEKINYFQAIKIGLYQSFAIFSGISRSGTCLLGGSELTNEDNTNYSFTLFIPVCVGALVNEISKGSISINIYSVVSFIFVIPITLLSLKLLKKLVNHKRYTYFGIYTFIIGMIILIINLL